MQDLLAEQCELEKAQDPKKNQSVEIQVCIPPITRDAQTQIAPEKRHIGKQQTTSISYLVS